MAKEQSIAPKERVNIVYKSATNAAEDVELPLKMLMMGDYTLQQDSRALEDRKPVSIDKENFNEVLAAHNINLNIQVPNRLQEGDQAGDLNVKLEIKNIRDFEPDQVIEQIPELKKLLEIRQALVALKGPLGNVPSFRKKLQSLVQNQETLTQLCQELGMNAKGEGV
ncbi:MAG: type VI secretion system contractile sheath small subunit [Gammaproteobacteria bacterium]|nr:type VI secretion system contractile sheath small subunit [Gammaproteobacteria bacterium]